METDLESQKETEGLFPTWVLGEIVENVYSGILQRYGRFNSRPLQ